MNWLLNRPLVALAICVALLILSAILFAQSVREIGAHGIQWQVDGVKHEFKF